MANEVRLAAAVAVNGRKKELRDQLAEAMNPVIEKLVKDAGGDERVVEDLQLFMIRGVNRATKRLIKEYDGSMDTDE